jgi:hypothetical protein
LSGNIFPTAIFTGGQHGEHITLVDVRAKACVYTLAVGNNNPTALAWDDRRSTLYAATECENVDRIGYHHGSSVPCALVRAYSSLASTDYRYAKIKQRYRLDATDADWEDPARDDADADEDAQDEDNSMDDDDFNEEECWPERAFQTEEFYGCVVRSSATSCAHLPFSRYAFDAGEHRLCGLCLSNSVAGYLADCVP